MKKLCIFAGSSSGSRPDYIDLARRIGGMIAARGAGIVYGGGRIGLMGAAADGAKAGGGFVHGIIPRFLETLEVGHQGVDELTITETMQERKSLMYAESDGFLALPGGYGTMEELLEILTQRQLGLHQKPIYVFNQDGYWHPVLTMFQDAVDQGFVRPHQLGLVSALDSIDDVADMLDNFTAEP